ncbi:hypothetical protein [Halosimplex sp. TS25]|uniref:hypothetical protein n=1 Tax=Halosimplex rarum TaxID=3396619 RepID=UPI0039EB2AAB
MMVNRRQLCLSCGVALSSGLAGCSGIFDQGPDPEESQDKFTNTGQETTESDEDTGPENDTETDNEGQTDSPNEESFDEDTETDEFVLDIFDLPDNFEFHDEELLIVSELPEDEPDREELEEKKIVRQHRREFVEDAELDGASFVSSAVYICETDGDALELKNNHVELVTEEREVKEAPKEEFEYQTTIATGEKNENDLVFTYLAHNQNLVYELTSVGSLEQTVVTSIYKAFINHD